MSDNKPATRNLDGAYWALIALAPLSILSAGTHVLPIFMWVCLALGFVAAINRFRMSRSRGVRIFAGIVSVIYGAFITFLVCTSLNLWP